MRLFECGLRYDKTMENGLNKPVTELFMVKAETFSESETKVISEMQPYIHSDYEVVTIKRSNCTEIARDNDCVDEKYYKAKVNLVTINECTGKEKKTALFILVCASTLDKAHDIVVDHLKGTMSNYEIANIDETKIVDVYR